MSYDYTKLPHAGIQQLQPYVPGKPANTVAREQHRADIIKLASNENPRGCSPLALAAMTNTMPKAVSSYPVARSHALRKALAHHIQLNKAHVFLGNGSDAIFHLLLECFALHTNKHILTHDYAFISYEVQAKTLGIAIKKTPLDQNWKVNIKALIQACTKDTALLFIANPNNPTGLLIEPEEIKYLLDHIPSSTLLVLDEAYYEYTPEHQRSHAPTWLGRYPNLILTRTFSKAYGLAGLRLGYALANPQIIELLYRIQLPFSVNQLALNTAIAALQDTTFVQETIQLNTQGLQQVEQGLTQLGLKYLPSSCNFITFDCGLDAVLLDQRLQAHGIITRPLDPYGLNQHLRVTIGTLEQNTRFLNALTLCLKETKHEQLKPKTL